MIRRPPRSTLFPTRRSSDLPTERQNLGCIKYQDNEVVLHSDVSLMPKLHKCWASWVYTERKDKSSEKIDLTYWMNSLQPIPLDDPMFVTLNSTRNIEHSQIFDQVTMRHPVYDLDVLEAQKEIAKTNGQNRTWFSGAWVKNGFHEDGLTSGLDRKSTRLNPVTSRSRMPSSA